MIHPAQNQKHTKTRSLPKMFKFKIDVRVMAIIHADIQVRLINGQAQSLGTLNLLRVAFLKYI